MNTQKIGWHASGIASAVATVVALVSLMPAAHAQDTGLRVKVGADFAQGSGRSFAGDTRYAAEAELMLPKILPGSGTTGVNIGFSQSRKDGRELRIIPVTVEKVFAPPNPVKRATGYVYYGAGVGAYMLHASGNGSSDTKTAPGGFGMVGYQLPCKYFIEAKYSITGTVNGTNANGLALMVGKSF